MSLLAPQKIKFQIEQRQTRKQESFCNASEIAV